MKRCGVMVLTVGSAFALESCGGSSSTTSKDTVNRGGVKIESTDPKFDDSSPSMSADGQRVVFLSGRAGGQGLRAYKRDMASEGAEIKRAVNADIGIETAVTISPDGQWLALVTEKDGKTRLYVQRFDDADAAPVAVDGDDDTAIESRPTFSPGATPMLAYEALTVGERGVTDRAVKVTQVDGSGALATPVTLPIPEVLGATSSWEQPVWTPRDAGFGLLTRLANPTAFATSWYLSTFADLASVAAPTQNEQAAGSVGVTEQSAAANTNGFFYVRKLPRADAAVIVPDGNKPEAERNPDTNKASVAARPFFLTFGNADAAAIETKQKDVLDIATTADGVWTVIVGQELLICKEGDVFGTSLILYNSTSKKTLRLVPRRKDGTWTLSSEPCKPGDDAAVEPDRRIVSAEITYDQATRLITIPYVSWWHDDYEVMRIQLLSEDGSNFTASEVRNLSENLK